MNWIPADLKNWSKHYEKSKSLTKILNSAIVTQRERENYFLEKGYFPEEFDWPEWKQGIERSRYVKKLTEANPTSTAKRPSRSRKAIKPPKEEIASKEPWRPPPH